MSFEKTKINKNNCRQKLHKTVLKVVCCQKWYLVSLYSVWHCKDCKSIPQSLVFIKFSLASTQSKAYGWACTFQMSCQSYSVFHITFLCVLYTSPPSVVLFSLSLRSCLNQHHTLLFSTPMAWLMKRRGKTVSRWQTCSLTNQNAQHFCGVQLAHSALYLVCRCKKRSLKRFVISRQTTIRALSLPQKVD